MGVLCAMPMAVWVMLMGGKSIGDKSNFCRFYASHFSFKSAPPIFVRPKAMRETRTKRKNHDGGATKPPFLGLVCFPPAENCSDRGAFCARRVEQQVVRAYPSSASGEHAVLCKCTAKFIQIQWFQNVGFPGSGHGEEGMRRIAL